MLSQIVAIVVTYPKAFALIAILLINSEILPAFKKLPPNSNLQLLGYGFGKLVDFLKSKAAIVLLPLAFLGLSACAGAQAWSKCELGQLPQIAEPLIPDVIQDLGGANTTQVIQQIEQLGGAIAPGQIACIVQAIVADINAKKAELSFQQKQVLVNASAFLAKHPACCGAKK